MIGAVILAAGESKRMGEPKLLLQVGGKRVIEWTVDSFKSVVDDVIVVLGYKPENLIPILEKLGIRWIINENYHEGMVSSFKKGLGELKDCEAIFLALGDQPFVPQNFLTRAIEAWKGGAKVVNPVYKGKKGHPVLFDRSLFSEILSLRKHEMVRDVIYRHEGERRLVEAGKWAVIDLDTPKDFQKALEEKR